MHSVINIQMLWKLSSRRHSSQGNDELRGIVYGRKTCTKFKPKLFWKDPYLTNLMFIYSRYVIISVTSIKG